MNWEKYEKKFIVKAKSLQKKDSQIKECLEYAKNLYEKNIPIIYDVAHFSKLVGYKKDFIFSISNSQKSFYRNFSISKRTGGTREIFEPLPSLKEIQTWILINILEKINISPYCKSYRKKVSLKENARFHVNKKIIVKLDIQNFFGTVEFNTILFLFMNELGYSRKLSIYLANICTLHGSLPQGAPTSPYLSNIVLKAFDEKISKYARKNNFCYTRYADDLTFSGDFANIKPGQLIIEVKKTLEEFNFAINRKKTRVIKRNKRQLVTGIVVNEATRAPREMRKKLRQEIYYIQKYGIHDHIKKIKLEKANYIKHLLGKANFIYSLNKKDSEVIGYINYLKSIYNELM